VSPELDAACAGIRRRRRRRRRRIWRDVKDFPVNIIDGMLAILSH